MNAPSGSGVSLYLKQRSLDVWESCLQVMVQWGGRWIKGIVLVCHGEEGAEPQLKALVLLVHLQLNPHL